MIKNRLLFCQIFEKFELQRVYTPGDRAKPFELVKVRSTEVRITQFCYKGFIGNSEGTEQSSSN